MWQFWRHALCMTQTVRQNWGWHKIARPGTCRKLKDKEDRTFTASILQSDWWQQFCWPCDLEDKAGLAISALDEVFMTIWVCSCYIGLESYGSGLKLKTQRNHMPPSRQLGPEAKISTASCGALPQQMIWQIASKRLWYYNWGKRRIAVCLYVVYMYLYKDTFGYMT